MTFVRRTARVPVVVASAALPRVVCERCRRPEGVCYCRFVTPLATRTRVVILQHPRERDVPINTARIASLCLPEAELHVGTRWDRPFGDADRPAALLYPGPEAIDIEESPPPGPITLVVVDGTWWQARKLVRSNPELARLPRYAFRPPKPSDYRIRKEPQEDYVSTIEALVHMLGVLEGDRERFEAMLVPFRAMVDVQLAYAAERRPSRHARARRPRRVPDPRARLPEPFRRRAHDLVCVYGEANAWPFGTKERAAGEDELVHWVACRVATGETFEAFVAPRGALAPATAHHAEVDAARIVQGLGHEALLEAWSRFVRPGDVVCSWGRYTADLFTRTGGELGIERVDLRRAARQFANARLGTIEAYADHVGAAPSAPLGQGRAGRRLAQMVSIVKALA